MPKDTHTHAHAQTHMQNRRTVTEFMDILWAIFRRADSHTCLIAVSPTLSECFLMLSRKSLRSDMEISLMSSLSLGRFSAIIWQKRYWLTLQVAQQKPGYVKLPKVLLQYYNQFKSDQQPWTAQKFSYLLMIMTVSLITISLTEYIIPCNNNI